MMTSSYICVSRFFSPVWFLPLGLKYIIVASSWASNADFTNYHYSTYLYIFSDTNMDQTEKQTKETDVELLCKYIYDYGEQYMDGTGAIIFSKLKQVRLYIFSSI